MDSFVQFLKDLAPFAPLLSAIAGAAGALAAYRAIRLNASIHRERTAYDDRRAAAARAGATYRYLVSEPLRGYVQELLEWSRTWLDPEARKLAEAARAAPAVRAAAARAFVRSAKNELDFLKTQLVTGVNVTTDVSLRQRVNAVFQGFSDEFGTTVEAWVKNPRAPLTTATFRPLLQRHAEALVAAAAEHDPELLMLASPPPASLPPARGSR
ncbi:MAG TPA: hypothetical protein VFS20_30480 [Longimicrobium sp.]|nr:hypothetical protein [Longimicrobium sp.]